jgi:hypothetical protein
VPVVNTAHVIEFVAQILDQALARVPVVARVVGTHDGLDHVRRLVEHAVDHLIVGPEPLERAQERSRVPVRVLLQGLLVCGFGLNDWPRGCGHGRRLGVQAACRCGAVVQLSVTITGLRGCKHAIPEVCTGVRSGRPSRLIVARQHLILRAVRHELLGSGELPERDLPLVREGLDLRVGEEPRQQNLWVNGGSGRLPSA